MNGRQRFASQHPPVEEIDLLKVLHALANPTRMKVVQTLIRDVEVPCGTFDIDVTTSTLTHHLRVLREAGVIEQRQSGPEKLTTLRLTDLNEAYPGVLTSIVNAYSLRK